MLLGRCSSSLNHCSTGLFDLGLLYTFEFIVPSLFLFTACCGKMTWGAIILFGVPGTASRLHRTRVCCAQGTSTVENSGCGRSAWISTYSWLECPVQHCDFSLQFVHEICPFLVDFHFCYMFYCHNVRRNFLSKNQIWTNAIYQVTQWQEPHREAWLSQLSL